MTPWQDTDLVGIGFLFVVCARMADGVLSEEEVVRIVQRMAAWMPGATTEQIHAMLERSVAEYQAPPDDRSRAELVEATARGLRQRLARPERERLMTELIGLTQADGEVDLGETDFVLAIARALDIQVALEG